METEEIAYDQAQSNYRLEAPQQSSEEEIMREKLGYLGLKSCVAGLAGLALSILPATSAPIVISKGLRVDDGQLVQAKTGRSGKGVVVDKRGFELGRPAG